MRLVRWSAYLLLVLLLVYGYRSYSLFTHFGRDIKLPQSSEQYYHLEPAFCQDECRSIDTSIVSQDEDGVYVVNFDRVKNLRVHDKRVYFPGTIGQLALTHYVRLKRYGNQEDRKVFLANVDWLAANIKASGCWDNPIDISVTPGRLVKQPWCSGLAQGVAISALVRAYTLTQDNKYLGVALHAARVFQAGVPDSVTSRIRPDAVCYEEVMDAGHPTCVLNGYIFAIFGLYDLTRVSSDPQIKAYYDAGMQSLITLTPQFDSGYWSYYSLDSVRSLANHYAIASPSYQRIHAEMYTALARMDPAPVLEQYRHVHTDYAHRGWFNIVVIPLYLMYQDFSLAYKWFRQLKE